MKFFIAYSYRNDEKLPKGLIEIGKKIVRSCNWLSLNLKVVSLFLEKQKRLKYYKRALKKLNKWRDLVGDEEDYNHKLWTISKINFDALKVEEKNMFLEICCFFNNNVDNTMKENIL